MHIVTILGARPQFIKLGPLSRMLDERGHRHTVIHTGQHWDARMSAIFFEQLALRPPDLNLGVGGRSDVSQVGHMMVKLEPSLAELQPDAVVVLGDTNSTIAGALVAAKLHFPVVHVEAGLRSADRSMPEEINRIVTDHVSDLLLAPTQVAVDNLAGEGIPASRVALTGDIMFDAHLMFRSRIDHQLVLDRFGLRPGAYVLVTLHRAENTDHGGRLRTVVDALRLLADEIPVLWPLHPRTRKALERDGIMPAAGSGLQIVEPVGYLQMLALEEQAMLIASDSGGVQKEAFFCRVPCVTLRDTTEWTELVELGWNRLCPPRSVAELLGGLRESVHMRGKEAEPYGDGCAARRMADEIQRFGA